MSFHALFAAEGTPRRRGTLGSFGPLETIEDNTGPIEDNTSPIEDNTSPTDSQDPAMSFHAPFAAEGTLRRRGTLGSFDPLETLGMDNFLSSVSNKQDEYGKALPETPAADKLDLNKKSKESYEKGIEGIEGMSLASLNEYNRIAKTLSEQVHVLADEMNRQFENETTRLHKSPADTLKVYRSLDERLMSIEALLPQSDLQPIDKSTRKDA